MDNGTACCLHLQRQTPTLYSLAYSYERFGRICCLHLQEEIYSKFLRNIAISPPDYTVITSKTTVIFNAIIVEEFRELIHFEK
jgi:hypothetical protein